MPLASNAFHDITDVSHSWTPRITFILPIPRPRLKDNWVEIVDPQEKESKPNYGERKEEERDGQTDTHGGGEREGGKRDSLTFQWSANWSPLALNIISIPVSL